MVRVTDQRGAGGSGPPAVCLSDLTGAWSRLVDIIATLTMGHPKTSLRVAALPRCRPTPATTRRRRRLREHQSSRLAEQAAGDAPGGVCKGGRVLSIAYQNEVASRLDWRSNRAPPAHRVQQLQSQRQRARAHLTTPATPDTAPAPGTGIGSRAVCRRAGEERFGAHRGAREVGGWWSEQGAVCAHAPASTCSTTLFSS